MKRFLSALMIAVLLMAGMNVLVGAASLKIEAEETSVTWSEGNLRMTVPIPANKLNFTGVSIRSPIGPYVSIPAEYLSVRHGSAKVTIAEEYLETLVNGQYILRYEFLYFHAPVLLTVTDPEVAEEEVPADAVITAPAALAEVATEAADDDAATEE